MTTRHEHSVFVEAPVETVFQYVEVPERFYSALTNRMIIETPNVKPGEVGGMFDWKVPYVGGIIERGQMTRVEYVPNERIVDKSSRGWVWTVITEPVAGGTLLTFQAEESSSIPFLDKLDATVFRVDHQLRKTLAVLKDRIESEQAPRTT